MYGNASISLTTRDFYLPLSDLHIPIGFLNCVKEVFYLVLRFRCRAISMLKTLYWPRDRIVWLILMRLCEKMSNEAEKEKLTINSDRPNRHYNLLLKNS